MDTLQPVADPFPLAPADVPERAACAVRRALMRGAGPEYVAAMVIAALCGEPDPGAILEVSATAPGRGFPLMTIAVPEARIGWAVGVVLGCCEGVGGVEVRVRRLA